VTTAAATPRQAPNLPARWWAFAARRPGICVAASFLFFVALASICAPWLPLADPIAVAPAQRLRPPSLEHFFGTDSFGRDVFSRALHGGRISMVVGLGVAVLSTVFGLAIGIVSGFYRWADAIIMRFVDAVMSIPAILLAIALVSINRPGTMTLIVAITIPEIPRVVRVVRSVVLTVREQTYIEAAVAAGTRPFKLLVRHVVPNAIAPLIVQATFICALAVILEASLSFLGAGTPPETPSWGNMMSAGRTFIRNAPWILLCPGLLLGLTVLSINVLGDRLRDMMDPRLAGRVVLR
jgi:peptide/nickel transport system permease protein